MDVGAVDFALSLEDDVGAILRPPRKEPEVGLVPAQAVTRLGVAEEVGTGVAGPALVDLVVAGVVQQQQLAQVAGAVTTGMAEVLAQVLAVVPMRWCALTSRSGGWKKRSCSCL